MQPGTFSKQLLTERGSFFVRLWFPKFENINSLNPSDPFQAPFFTQFTARVQNGRGKQKKMVLWKHQSKKSITERQFSPNKILWKINYQESLSQEQLTYAKPAALLWEIWVTCKPIPNTTTNKDTLNMRHKAATAQQSRKIQISTMYQVEEKETSGI